MFAPVRAWTSSSITFESKAPGPTARRWHAATGSGRPDRDVRREMQSYRILKNHPGTSRTGGRHYRPGKEVSKPSSTSSPIAASGPETKPDVREFLFHRRGRTTFR